MFDSILVSVSPDIYPLIHHHSTLAETSSCFSGCLLVSVSADSKLPDSCFLGSLPLAPPHASIVTVANLDSSVLNLGFHVYQVGLIIAFLEIGLFLRIKWNNARITPHIASVHKYHLIIIIPSIPPFSPGSYLCYFLNLLHLFFYLSFFVGIGSAFFLQPPF